MTVNYENRTRITCQATETDYSLTGTENVDIVELRTAYRGDRKQVLFYDTAIASTSDDKAQQSTLHLAITPTTTTPALCEVDLKGFAPNDRIRFGDGEYSIGELTAHGVDAPFYKRAQIEAEVNAQFKKSHNNARCNR